MLAATKAKSRVDENGRAYAGSQRQLQTYVNEHAERLSAAVMQAIGVELTHSAVDWVSPLVRDNYAEYKDGDFLCALGLGSLTAKLAGFWPNSGPRWDGLAKFAVGGRMNYILVEAKSHVPEMYSNGCCAKSERSLDKINAALSATKMWVGAPQGANWTGALYQHANRLGHLYWFRQVLRLDAWLVKIYFVGDPHSPTSSEEWQHGLASARAELGISDVSIPGAVDVFLPALQ